MALPQHDSPTGASSLRVPKVPGFVVLLEFVEVTNIGNSRNLGNPENYQRNRNPSLAVRGARIADGFW